MPARQKKIEMHGSRTGKVGFDFEVDEVGCLILEVGDDKDSTTEAGL